MLYATEKQETKGGVSIERVWYNTRKRSVWGVFWWWRCVVVTGGGDGVGDAGGRRQEGEKRE